MRVYDRIGHEVMRGNFVATFGFKIRMFNVRD